MSSSTHQPEQWRVKARAGVAEGTSTFLDAPDELDAEQTAEGWRSKSRGGELT